MTQFKDVDEILDEYLDLPVKGKVYRIASPSARAGLRIETLAHTAIKIVQGGEASASDKELLDDEDERGLYQLALGATFGEMVEDEVPWNRIKHAGMTVVLWVSAGLEAAQMYWESGGASAEATRPANRAERRATSASVKSTPTQGSTSGTNRAPGGSRRRRPAPGK